MVPTPDKPTLVNGAFLAARWGVTAWMINEYVRKYDLPVAIKGKSGSKGSQYDLAKADAWYGSFLPSAKGGKKPRHAGDPPGHDRTAVEVGTVQEDEDSGDGDETPREKAAKYKLQQEREKARKLQMENDKRAGKLVEHAVVIDATARLLGEVRVQLEAIAHRLAPDLAASALVDQSAVDAIRKELGARGADDAKVEALCGPLTRVGLEAEIRRQIEASVRQTLRELSEP